MKWKPTYRILRHDDHKRRDVIIRIPPIDHEELDEWLMNNPQLVKKIQHLRRLTDQVKRAIKYINEYD